MRIAFHAINGVGLGHLTRVTAIALEVRALRRDAVILVLTSATDTTLLRSAGLDFVRFPPGLAEPHADPDRVRRTLPPPLMDAVQASVLDAFRPDLVVFDTHPPIALARHAAAIGARTVLVQRELRPEILEAFVASDAPAAFDRIVVPHEPGEVDLRAAAHLPVVITGPVVRALDDRLPPGEAAPQVLVLTGGGGQPVEVARYLRAAVDAHILARERIAGLTTLIVAGPYGRVPEQAHRGVAGLRVIGACAHLPALIARASVVVSQAGYNTVAELRALGKPAIFVPGWRKAEDQTARARRLVKAGAALLARPNARSIADALESVLLTQGALDAMAAAHRRSPLIPKNRAVAEAVLGPLAGTREVRRVVLVAYEFPPRVGGMETAARSLARGLAAQGIDVRVYAPKTFGPDGSGLAEGAVRRLYAREGRGVDLWGDLLITLDALLTDAPDVIHLCNAGLAPWVPALRAAFPAPVTVSAHGSDVLAPWIRHGGDPSVYRAVQIAGLRAADGVFVASAAASAAVASAGVARHEVIGVAVDCERFTPARDIASESVLSARLGIVPTDEVLLTVSRLVPRKGHAMALRAFAKVLRRRPRALLVFTGVDARLEAELAALAGKLGVEGRVRAVGVVSDEDLPALYRLARVFLLLSEDHPREVNGWFSALEAAASGVPVVATRARGAAEVVADGETGALVALGDIVGAARAIRALLEDPARARELGERGRARAVGDFEIGAWSARVAARWMALVSSRDLPPRGRPLTGFAAAFQGDTSPTADGRVVFAREALRAGKTGVGLLRIAQGDASTRRRAADHRRATFGRIIQGGDPVRLRALDGGASLLVDAIGDCAALAHQPIVEMRLRRFAQPDFLASALPLVRAVHLVHTLPSADPRGLLDRLTLLPDADFAKIQGLRFQFSRACESSPTLAFAALRQASALEQLFTARSASARPAGHLGAPFALQEERDGDRYPE